MRRLVLITLTFFFLLTTPSVADHYNGHQYNPWGRYKNLDCKNIRSAIVTIESRLNEDDTFEEAYPKLRALKWLRDMYSHLCMEV